uniref:Rad21_Rec8_N domain-containing protein n=1 Tax=Macrostomum lignano TaxID=282301 RepID=A0A1I8I846_9PLAT
MFYAHFVLTKKGPLAKIWLAAHWDKKLTKAHVFETNISSSVEAILEPKVKMALRTSGHLLLGVVKIYNRKAKYLLADCNEAYVKIKMAFRPGAVDLPEKSREAAAAAITLPDNLQDFESEDLTHIADQLSVPVVHTSRPEDITMKELDAGEAEINLGRPDDDFGEAALETMRDAGAESLYSQGANSTGQADDIGSIGRGRHSNQQHQDSTLVDMENAADEIGLLAGPAGDDDDDEDGFGGDFEPTDLFDDLTTKRHFENVLSEIDLQPQPQPTAPSSVLGEQESRYALPPLPDISSASAVGSHQHQQHQQAGQHHQQGASGPSEPSVRSHVTARRARRRRLIIDDQKSIPSELMKAHMQDTSEIVTVLDLAPPTKKLMQWKETGSVDRLLSHTARLHLSDRLLRLFAQNARTRPAASGADAAAAAAAAAAEDEDADMRDLQELITSETPHHHHHQHHESVAMTPIREELSHGLISTNTDPLIASSAPADQPLIPASVPLHGSVHTPFPFHHGDTDIVDQVGGPPSVFNPTGLSAEEDLDRQITCEDVEEATEEARTERRGAAMLKVLQLRLEGRSAAEPCTVSELTIGNGRKAAAAKFYTLLTLCKVRGVEMQQNDGPYSNIYVQKGARFASLLSSAFGNN